jgi:hypothetical protein
MTLRMSANRGILLQNSSGLDWGASFWLWRFVGRAPVVGVALSIDAILRSCCEQSFTINIAESNSRHTQARWAPTAG